MGRRTLRRENGQILVITAVSLVTLLGIAALSIDAAYLYDQRNKLYAAADAAAKSAAFAHQRNAASDDWTFGAHEVGLLGLGPAQSCTSTSGTVLCMNRGPSSGPFTGNAGFVEAIVSQPSTATFFGKVLGWTSANPGARAVAGSVNPADCVIINQNLTIGNTAFTLQGCGLSVGGNLDGTNPNAIVEDPGGAFTPPVNVAGTCLDYCAKMGDLTTGAAAPLDPLASKLTAPTAPDPATCVAGTTPTIGPGCYNNISAAVTTLLPGDYYITGTVNIDNLSGTNVFLYMTGAAKFNITGNNKQLSLTAETSGPYQGVAVWQDVNDTQPFLCGSCMPDQQANQFTLGFNGAIYMPGVDQLFKNTLDILPSTCSLFIARNLSIGNGSGSFSNTGCAGLYGGAAYLSVAVVE